DVHRETAIAHDIAPTGTRVRIDRSFPFHGGSDGADMVRMYVDVAILVRIAQTGSRLAIHLIEVSAAKLHVEATEESAALRKRCPTQGQGNVTRFGFDITAGSIVVVGTAYLRIERHVAGT